MVSSNLGCPTPQRLWEIPTMPFNGDSCPICSKAPNDFPLSMDYLSHEMASWNPHLVHPPNKLCEQQAQVPFFSLDSLPSCLTEKEEEKNTKKILLGANTDPLEFFMQTKCEILSCVATGTQMVELNTLIRRVTQTKLFFSLCFSGK